MYPGPLAPPSAPCKKENVKQKKQNNQTPVLRKYTLGSEIVRRKKKTHDVATSARLTKEILRFYHPKRSSDEVVTSFISTFPSRLNLYLNGCGRFCTWQQLQIKSLLCLDQLINTVALRPPRRKNKKQTNKKINK